MSVRKSSHGTIFLIVSSGSPRALIASSLRSTSKKPFCPMTRSLHPPMTACGHRVRFVATWREEFFEVPWSDLVFLEPLSLDDVAGKGNRLLLILRRKEQFGHLLFQALKVSQRFTSWIDHGAGFSPINASRADRNTLVLLCNGRDLEVRPSALFEQAASQIVFMQPLHDDHDRAGGLRIEAREKGRIEPLAGTVAMRFR